MTRQRSEEKEKKRFRVKGREKNLVRGAQNILGGQVSVWGASTAGV